MHLYRQLCLIISSLTCSALGCLMNMWTYRPPARWAHGLLWWPRTAITNVVSCLVKRLSLFLYCLSEIKFTTTTTTGCFLTNQFVPENFILAIKSNSPSLILYIRWYWVWDKLVHKYWMKPITIVSVWNIIFKYDNFLNFVWPQKGWHVANISNFSWKMFLNFCSLCKCFQEYNLW